jgi:hypothetical protein
MLVITPDLIVLGCDAMNEAQRLAYDITVVPEFHADGLCQPKQTLMEGTVGRHCRRGYLKQGEENRQHNTHD